MHDTKNKRDLTLPWQGMHSAPRDGTVVLVLLEGSDIPHSARWLSGNDAPNGSESTRVPCWYIVWDGSPVAPHDGPRYWMPCPYDPDS